MLRGTEYAVLTVANRCLDESPKAAADLGTLPGDNVIRRCQPLIDYGACACPECIIRRDIETGQAGRVRVRIAISCELARERLRIAVVTPLPKMAHTRCIA